MRKPKIPNPFNHGNHRQTDLPPLPPDFEWEDRTIYQLAKTAVRLQSLRWFVQFADLPSPHFDPLLARKAVDAQRLIGQETSLFELYQTEFSLKQNRKLAPHHLISLDHYISLKQHMILSISNLDDLLHLHSWLTVRTDTPEESVFRTGSSISPTPSQPCPPANQIESGLKNLADYLKQSKYPHPLVKIAFTYYQIMALQPFATANTEFALLLVDKLLIRFNQFPLPFLNLAVVFRKRHHQYQEKLLACNQQADFNAWLGFFFESVEQAAADTTNLVRQRFKRLVDLNKDLNEIFGPRFGGNLAAFFMRTPAFSPSDLAQSLRFSKQHTKRFINRLQSDGTVLQFPEGTGYYLPDVINFWDSQESDTVEVK